jgi:hypothetical protein
MLDHVLSFVWVSQCIFFKEDNLSNQNHALLSNDSTNHRVQFYATQRERVWGLSEKYPRLDHLLFLGL